jgi:hypothetical protein
MFDMNKILQQYHEHIEQYAAAFFSKYPDVDPAKVELQMRFQSDGAFVCRIVGRDDKPAVIRLKWDMPESHVQTNRRCQVTGNECGTDTWQYLKPCKCDECQAYMWEKIDALVEGLRFYGDPDTYFAIGFSVDRPAGAFEDDLSEVPLFGTDFGSGFTKIVPGKRARIILGWEKDDDDKQSTIDS